MYDEELDPYALIEGILETEDVNSIDETQWVNW